MAVAPLQMNCWHQNHLKSILNRERYLLRSNETDKCDPTPLKACFTLSQMDKTRLVPLRSVSRGYKQHILTYHTALFLAHSAYIFLNIKKLNFNLRFPIIETGFSSKPTDHSAINVKVTHLCSESKIKDPLVQALRLCTGRTARRGSRGIALL
jgi:hypothetical protein